MAGMKTIAQAVASHITSWLIMTRNNVSSALFMDVKVATSMTIINSSVLNAMMAYWLIPIQFRAIKLMTLTQTHTAIANV